MQKFINDYLKKITFAPTIALVLGTGLGDFAETTEVVAILKYKDIPSFPVSNVSGHAGQFVFCKVGGKNLVIMQGRVHLYEGYSMQDVTLPIRFMRMCGAEILILTNAAGGINLGFNSGDLMLIEDHIMNVINPLIGELQGGAVVFSDMTEVYSKKLKKIIEEVSEKLQIQIKKGVYVQLSGPSYETPSEIKMWRVLGADAVGMSTACEAVVAKSIGFKTCGISLISNMAAGISGKELSHEEVKNSGLKCKQDFSKLITNLIKALQI